MMHPQPCVQNKNKHTSVVTTVTPEQPGIPRTMVYGLFRALPGDRAFLTPSPANRKSTSLTPTTEASGPHGFAVRISTFRQGRLHVHRIPFRVRDDREPPPSRERDSVWIIRNSDIVKLNYEIRNTIADDARSGVIGGRPPMSKMTRLTRNRPLADIRQKDDSARVFKHSRQIT